MLTIAVRLVFAEGPVISYTHLAIQYWVMDSKGAVNYTRWFTVKSGIVTLQGMHNRLF